MSFLNLPPQKIRFSKVTGFFGYYALLLIILVFFVGENYPDVFRKNAAKKVFLYAGSAALLSQAVFIHRNLPEFLNGYTGPGVRIAKTHSKKIDADIGAASLACGIDPVRSKGLIVDDYTYLYFRKSKWPMGITYVELKNDTKSVRNFYATRGSDGMIVHRPGFPEPYLATAKCKGEVCCLSRDALKKVSSLP